MAEPVQIRIEMSGADVLLVYSSVPGGGEAEVEVRQLHQDFFGDDEILEDETWPGCKYVVAWPPPHKREKGRRKT
jgi:hypothetical protein